MRVRCVTSLLLTVNRIGAETICSLCLFVALKRYLSFPGSKTMFTCLNVCTLGLYRWLWQIKKFT